MPRQRVGSPFTSKTVTDGYTPALQLTATDGYTPTSVCHPTVTDDRPEDVTEDMDENVHESHRHAALVRCRGFRLVEGLG